MQEYNTILITEPTQDLRVSPIPKLKTLHRVNQCKFHPFNFIPYTIGPFETISNPPKGKPIKKRLICRLRGALLRHTIGWCCNKILLDIWDVILIIYVYNFFTKKFQLPKRFHSDFNRKLISGKSLRWILDNGSNTISAPSSRQSSNVLVECIWHTLIQMARAYITENNLTDNFGTFRFVMH